METRATGGVAGFRRSKRRQNDEPPLGERRVRRKLAIAKELWQYMRVRKKWWLFPIVVFLVLLGLILILGKSSPLAPLIYPLF